MDHRGMFELPEWLRKPMAEEPKEGYFEVELTPKLRLCLLDLLRGKKITSAAVKMIETQVSCARFVDLPLKMASLDWSDLEAEAKRQGVSAVEILWDRAGNRQPAE